MREGARSGNSIVIWRRAVRGRNRRAKRSATVATTDDTTTTAIHQAATS